MKLKKGFVLREVAGETVVVPVEAELNFNGMITLNEAAKVLWSVLENETSTEDLVKAILSEFDVDEKTAQNDVDAFVQKLKGLDFLE
ncbi:MAG: PqqD family protein [Clostridia bacterium]|nr:PqqD family protein [Clostridia bacterium]